MSKFLSGRQSELKVGIVSYSENNTVLQVVGNTNVTGIVTAAYFYGDGSNLTNITASANASVAIGTTPPPNPNGGDLWYSSILGRTFVYYVDNDSSQWVDSAPFNLQPADIGAASVTVGSTPPVGQTNGDLWYSTVIGRLFIWYSDEDSSQWVDAAPFNIADPILTPGKTSSTFTATEGQTVFPVSYEIGYIDVFLNGIRLNSTEFVASNGVSVTLLTPASANDVLDVVEYVMGVGAPGADGAPGAGGPIDNITETTSNETFYPIITTGIGTTLPYITTTNNYFEFNPSSGTLTTNQLNIVGVVTASAFFGNGSGLTGVGIGSTGSINTVGIITASAFFGNGSGLTGVGIGSTGSINTVGIITASAFFGDGSGLTGAGSTVVNNTSTNATFYPIFTQQTSGTITASGISTSKLTFNPSTGTLTAIDINSTSDINLKENIRPIENPLDKILQINGIEFDWKDNQQSSIGVIAQEIEKVFPSLVKTAENKSVNYNGLIGVLIEAVKEQQEQINILKKRIEELEE